MLPDMDLVLQCTCASSTHARRAGGHVHSAPRPEALLRGDAERAVQRDRVRQLVSAQRVLALPGALRVCALHHHRRVRRVGGLAVRGAGRGPWLPTMPCKFALWRAHFLARKAAEL